MVTNFYRVVFAGILSLSPVLLLTGCESSHTSPYHPGPVIGQAVGNTAGTIAGNAAGLGAGVVEGTAHGLVAPFNPNYKMVRHWRAETTSDGRTIQVPYDVLVDQYGRPVNMPAPTGNPPPPPMTPVNTNAPVQ